MAVMSYDVMISSSSKVIFSPIWTKHLNVLLHGGDLPTRGPKMLAAHLSVTNPILHILGLTGMGSGLCILGSP